MMTSRFSILLGSKDQSNTLRGAASQLVGDGKDVVDEATVTSFLANVHARSFTTCFIQETLEIVTSLSFLKFPNAKHWPFTSCWEKLMILKACGLACALPLLLSFEIKAACIMLDSNDGCVGSS